MLNASQKAGLQVNAEKTKYMTNRDTGALYISNMVIGNVNEFTYLGQIMPFTDKMDKELQTRISKTWKGYWVLRQIFKSKMPIPLKTRILESCILPILLYSSQTWTLTEHQAVRLQITQRAMERSLLGINKKNKIKNEVIRQRTRMKDVIYIAKKLKLKYAGHMARSKNERWNKKVTEWFLLGYSRKKGRPALRCRQEIEQRMRLLWTRATQNRKIWKKLGEAYAQEWASSVR